jgi:putative peptidoglycan lipid II flippase
MNKLLKIIPAGSTVLGITSLASYVLGMLRDRTFAQTLGASRDLDAYNAAFLLPDLFFNFLIASGIAAAFVPLFTELFYSDKKKAYDYANSVISGASIITTLAAIILFIFSGSVSHLVAPGFGVEGQKLVAEITRILAIAPILFGISNTLGAMLIAKKRFFFYGMSPVLYNLGIIGGTIFLYPKFGASGIALGTICGAFLHMFIRLAGAYQAGFKLDPQLKFKTPEFRKTIKLMLPKMFGHPIELAMFWGFTIITSTLGFGAIAVMNFARNFQSVPVSLIGITFSTTAFPLMAKAISDHSPKEFDKILKQSFWLILGGSTFAALVMFLIREPLVRLVLGGGSFDEYAVMRTSMTLGVFVLAMPTESLRHLLARAFYATKNTAIPVMTSVIGLIIAIGGGFLLVPYLDILSIPAAFSTASLVEVIILLIALPHRLKKLPAQPQVDFDIK